MTITVFFPVVLNVYEVFGYNNTPRFGYVLKDTTAAVN